MLRYETVQVRSDGAQLAEFGRLLDDGTVRVAEGHLRGKLVLTVT